ncbi:hypothetical protein N8I77_006381 [Diaporthe amygdali]|uniref:BTB domain-containing protein n=1 Tax=Phomopsis amygdali TaxID=1214568 RepID=A0AAD9W6J4_PHOAM|nr:hypothetical protein N8I77_006381 [Diaporthe amygdali]
MGAAHHTNDKAQSTQIDYQCTLESGGQLDQISITPKTTNRDSSRAPEFGSRIVTFLVGPEKVRFCVHESIFSQAEAGKFFNTAFTNGFLETSTGLMELPEDGPDEFQCFLRWLYGTWMEPKEFSICWAELEFSQQIRLYAFAHKYTIDDLQNAIICDLHDLERTN